jgi:flagellar basal-body rod protein FlgF
VDALSIAALSMRNDIDRVANVGHNIANLSTPGYRSIVEGGQALHYAGLQSQAQSLLVSLDAKTSLVDPTVGSSVATGNRTDLAIDGDGYFELQSPEGLMVTRRGDFRLDRDGQLVSSSGYPVLGQNGPIVVSSGQIRIEADGRVFDNDKQIDQLKVVRVIDPTQLVAQGNGNFFVDEITVEDVKVAHVRAGFLEGSNVNSASEMIKLVELVKHIEANQRVMQYQDEMLGKALDKFAEI